MQCSRTDRNLQVHELQNKAGNPSRGHKQINRSSHRLNLFLPPIPPFFSIRYPPVKVAFQKPDDFWFPLLLQLTILHPQSRGKHVAPDD